MPGARSLSGLGACGAVPVSPLPRAAPRGDNAGPALPPAGQAQEEPSPGLVWACSGLSPPLSVRCGTGGIPGDQAPWCAAALETAPAEGAEPRARPEPSVCRR